MAEESDMGNKAWVDSDVQVISFWQISAISNNTCTDDISRSIFDQKPSKSLALQNFFATQAKHCSSDDKQKCSKQCCKCESTGLDDFLRIWSVNVRLCWTAALGFAKINKVCAYGNGNRDSLRFHLCDCCRVDWTFCGRALHGWNLRSILFFHWYCSEFCTVIDGIHVFLKWWFCVSTNRRRKYRRRHPCKSQDVPWRSAMAWECRRFVGFTAVQTIRVFGRKMQKWWKWWKQWKPWKWCRHRWRELFNGNCFVLGQLFPLRSTSQGSSAYDNRETWHYYTADPTAPRFCELDGAVLDGDLWRWTWCPLDIRRFQPLPRQWLGDQTSHSRTTWKRLQLCWVSWFSHVDCKSWKKLLPHPPTIWRC